MPPADEPPTSPDIDLGDDFDTLIPPARPPLPVRWTRAYRIAIPLLAVLLLVAASTVPARSPLSVAARVAIGLDARVLVTGEVVIVVDIRSRHNNISEYALRGGRLIWTQPLRVMASDGDIDLAGGSVVVSMADVDVSGPHTQAFDVRTGRHLWDSDDQMESVTANGDVITDRMLADGSATIHRVNARTGVAYWSLAIPTECLTSVAGDPDHGLPEALVEMCLTITPTGIIDVDHVTLRSVDLATGIVHASRHLDITPFSGVIDLPANELMASPQLDVFNDIVAVAHQNSPTPTVDAYQVGDLAPLWSGLPISSTESLENCGLDLCLVSGAGSTELDPHTGKVIGPGAPFGEPEVTGASYVLVVRGRPLDGPGTYAVAQVPDGASVAVPETTPGAVWLAARAYDTTTRLPVTTPIEPLTGVGPGGCVLAGPYLACATGPDELTFWRLPT